MSLTAAAAVSSTFTGWTGACQRDHQPLHGHHECRGSVTAAFAIKTYTLTASAGSGGSISPTGGINVNHGASQTFTITPSTGYTIASVLVDGVSQGTPNSYTFSNVTAAHTIQATFAAIPYTLSVSKSGTGTGTVTATGISCGTDCSKAYTAGTSVSLTAATAVSSTFTGWTGACHGIAALHGHHECRRYGDGRLRHQNLYHHRLGRERRFHLPNRRDQRHPRRLPDLYHHPHYRLPDRQCAGGRGLPGNTRQLLFFQRHRRPYHSGHLCGHPLHPDRFQKRNRLPAR